MNDQFAAQIAEVNSEVAAAAEAETKRPVRIDAKIAKRAAELAKKQTEYRIDDAQSDIANYAEWTKKAIERIRTAAEEARKQADAWADAFALLKSAGFKPKEHEYNRWQILVVVKERQLVRLAKVVGRIDVDAAAKEIHNADARTIRITASPVRYDFVRVQWIHQLAEDDKCQILSETTTKHRLVCKRGD